MTSKHKKINREDTFWRTPVANGSGIDPSRLVMKDGSSPVKGCCVYDRITGKKVQIGLIQQIFLWPKSTACSLKQPETKSRQNNPSEKVSISNKKDMNPEWVEWLMGFPAGWTSLDL
jgi:hypothetical protein